MDAATDDLAGIQCQAVSQWMTSVIPDAMPPFRFARISGGHSNLTFRVTDSHCEAWILRRPPLGDLMPTAHDVWREYRVINALGDSDVPVPQAFGFCDDDEVTGAPFYVMSCVPGMVVHDREAAEQYFDLAARSKICETLVDTLVAFQSVDFEAVGLGDLGRRDYYIARQLKRFGKMYELCAPDNPELMLDILRELDGKRPAQRGATLVHGDLRLGNCVCTSSGEIAAVLDWETCTLGDPLTDISLIISLWGHPSAPEPHQPDAPSMAPGFWSQEKMLHEYAARSGRDLSQMDYYIAFQYWRMAVIWEEINARHKCGAYGEAREWPEARDNAAYFADAARDRLGRCA